jgi:selenocysteine lyase/cysteine desulfurase
MARGSGEGRRAWLGKLAAGGLALGLAPGQAAAGGRGDPLPGAGRADALLPPPALPGPRGSERRWRAVRHAFVLPDDYIHMNTGTTGSQPAFVLNNLAVYDRYKCRDPRDWELNLAADFPDLFPLAPTAIAARQAAVAAAYGANPEEIVLSYDTTDACNLIFAGTPWSPGDRVITTSFEHPALAGPIAWARDHRGVEVRVIDMPSRFTADYTVEEVLAWFEAELARPLPAGAKQYVACSEVFYKNGLRLPIPELCALARAYGAFSIVDSAHGWGHLPIDCHGYGADFIAGAGHKWLCGGPGTGILYVRTSGAGLPPFAMGNFFAYGNLFQAPSVNFQGRAWRPSASMQPRGEANTPALYAMTDALSLFTAVGLPDVYARALGLARALRQQIVARWGRAALWVEENPDPRFATALTSFNPFQGKDDPAQFATLNAAIAGVLAALAAERPKIYVRSTTWRDRAADGADDRVGFRIATHAMYNDHAQIDWVVERLAAQVDATGLPQLR